MTAINTCIEHFPTFLIIISLGYILRSRIIPGMWTSEFKRSFSNFYCHQSFISPTIFFFTSYFIFLNFMHKLYTIIVLICILVRDSKIEHFISVCYLCFLFADHLLMPFTHLHQSWYFSFCSHELFVQYWKRLFPGIFDKNISLSMLAFLFQLW